MRTPALDAWRRELAAGKRTKTTFDALWRAACAEMYVLEAPTPELRIKPLARAREALQDAVRQAG